MRKYYLKSLFLFVFICVNFYSSDNIFSKENTFQGKPALHNSILKEIANLSDQEIYELAKKTNNDAIPGKINYSQILLTEAIRKNPKNVHAFLEMARIIDMQISDPLIKMQKKFGLLYQAFLIDPDNPKVRYKFASILLELGQKELFQKIYIQTMQTFPNHPDTLIEKIQIFSKTNPDKAIALSATAINNGANIEDFLEDFLFAIQNSTNSEHFAEKLLIYAKQYQNRWLWYQLGLEYVKNKQYSRAEDAFTKSIVLGNEIIGKLQLGILQYRSLNKINNGIHTLETVIDSVKNDPFISTKFIYLAHVQLTCALMLSKNKQATQKELNFVAKYAFQNRPYFMDLMNEFIRNGEENLLPDSLTIAIQNDPLFAESYSVLSSVLKKQKKDALSQAAYQKFLVINSQKK